MYSEAIMGARHFNRDQPASACAVGFRLRLPDCCVDANGERAWTPVQGVSLTIQHANSFTTSLPNFGRKRPREVDCTPAAGYIAREENGV